MIDNAKWVPLNRAYQITHKLRPRALDRTIRKFLIAILIHQDQSGARAKAKKFTEYYEKIDREIMPDYISPEEYDQDIPNDFWQIGMALNLNAEQDFIQGNITSKRKILNSELPYRLRGTDNDDDEVTLFQTATDIHLESNALIGLAQDSSWQRWSDIKSITDRGKRGRPQEWKWDDIKARFTVEVARNPEILNQKPAQIIKWFIDALAHEHNGQTPEVKEIRPYVKSILDQWKVEPDIGAPVN